MKKFYALLSVLIFMLCGCSDKVSDSAQESTAESTIDILIPLSAPNAEYKIPDNFERFITESNQDAYVFNDASIIVNEDLLGEKYSNINEYILGSEQLYQSFTDKYEEIDRQTFNTNGFDTTLLEFKYELKGESGILSKTCLVAFYADTVNNLQNIFIITCKSDTENYEDYKEDFMNTVQSFKLKE